MAHFPPQPSFFLQAGQGPTGAGTQALPGLLKHWLGLKGHTSGYLVSEVCNSITSRSQPSQVAMIGRDQEDNGSRPACDPVFKITRAKWTGGVAQAATCFASVKP
jgi:hypothetical protein